MVKLRAVRSTVHRVRKKSDLEFLLKEVWRLFRVDDVIKLSGASARSISLPGEYLGTFSDSENESVTGILRFHFLGNNSCVLKV